MKEREGCGAGQHQIYMDLDLVPNLKHARFLGFFFMSFLIWGQSSLQSGSRFSIYISDRPASRNPEEIGFLFFQSATPKGANRVWKMFKELYMEKKEQRGKENRSKMWQFS